MNNLIILHFYKNFNNNYVDIQVNNHIDHARYDSYIIEGYYKILEKLEEEDQECFDYFLPWQKILKMKDKEQIIIVFDIVNKYIQGWCMLQKDFFQHNSKQIFYLYLDKFIVRRNPDIKEIDKIMMVYIHP